MQWADKDGVARTYREVQRGPRVGDVVKYSRSRTVRVVSDSDVIDANFETHLSTATAKQFHVTVYEIVADAPIGYREVKRNARVGELIRVINTTDARYQIGDVFEVDEAYMGGNVMVRHSEGRNKRLGYPRACILESEYVVLEPVAADSDLSTRLSALEQRVAALESRLSPVDVDSADVANTVASIADADAKYHVSISPTSPYTREQVVELAERDIEELLHKNYPAVEGFTPSVWFVTEGGKYGVCNECKFVVNRKKRAVVALIWLIDCEVQSKGIAHCTPDDCFNVHIGKAIALRRALGLDVPAYYTDAPQPTEACVGDVVRSLFSSEHYIIDDNRRCGIGYAHTNSAVAQHGRVLDDSHDYGGTQHREMI